MRDGFETPDVVAVKVEVLVREGVTVRLGVFVFVAVAVAE